MEISVSGGGNNKSAKPRTEGREVSYGKIGLTTMVVTQDFISGMSLVLKIEFISIWNSILPEPGQSVPNCPTSYASLHARRPCIQMIQ